MNLNKAAACVNGSTGMLRWISSDFNFDGVIRTTDFDGVSKASLLSITTNGQLHEQVGWANTVQARPSARLIAEKLAGSYPSAEASFLRKKRGRKTTRKTLSSGDAARCTDTVIKSCSFTSPITGQAWPKSSASITTSPKSVDSVTAKEMSSASQLSLTDEDASAKELLSVASLIPPIEAVISQQTEAATQLVPSPLFSPRNSKEDVAEKLPCAADTRRPKRPRISSSSSEEDSPTDNSFSLSQQRHLELHGSESELIGAAETSISHAQSVSNLTNGVLLSPPLGNLLDRFPPASLEEIAVGKSKVSEVTKWLADSMMFARASRIAVFVGNAGCGKSTVLELLAQKSDMQYVIVSSSTAEAGMHGKYAALHDVPIDNDYNADGLADDVGVCQLFERQLVSAVSTVTDDDYLGGKLVVVEDIPLYYAARMPRAFHELLQRISRVIVYPLAFVYTEHYVGRGYLNRLFTPDIMIQVNARTIRFNPLAPTFIQKALQRILRQAVAARFAANRPSLHWKETDLRRFGETSRGDLRGAIHTLEFVAAECLGTSSAARETTEDLIQARSQRELSSSPEVIEHLCNSPTRRGRRTRGGRGRGRGSGSTQKQCKRIKSCAAGLIAVTPSRQSQKTLNILGAAFQRDPTVHLFHTIGRLIFVRRYTSNPADFELFKKKQRKNWVSSNRNSVSVDRDNSLVFHAVDDVTFAEDAVTRIDPREPAMPRVLCGAGRERCPLLYEPEAVAQEAHVQPDALLLFAHENAYGKFVAEHEQQHASERAATAQSLALMAEMADSLSQADLFADTGFRFSNSNEPNPLQRYCESVTTRTLMYYNNDSADGDAVAAAPLAGGRLGWANSPAFYRYRKQHTGMLEMFVEASTADEDLTVPGRKNDIKKQSDEAEMCEIKINHATKGSSVATLATEILPALLQMFSNDLLPNYLTRSKSLRLPDQCSANAFSGGRRHLAVSSAMQRCAVLYHKFNLITGQKGDELSEKCQVDDNDELPVVPVLSPPAGLREEESLVGTGADFATDNADSKGSKLDMAEEEFFIEEIED